MLKLIEGSYASLFPREMDAMFRNRAEIFGERLGWEVVVKNGYERDRFDDLNPLYLVSVDPATGAYWGSLRLLPTTGPNMLRDVFPQLLEEGEVVESATIWESSRICAIAARAARTHEERPRLCVERVDRPDRRGRAAGRVDPDRLGVRRAHPARPESRRMRAGDHRQTAALEALRAELGMEDSVLGPGGKELGSARRPPSHKRLNRLEHITAGPHAGHQLRRLARSRNWTVLPAVLEQLF